jgi:hypothetical protein
MAQLLSKEVLYEPLQQISARVCAAARAASQRPSRCCCVLSRGEIRVCNAPALSRTRAPARAAAVPQLAGARARRHLGGGPRAVLAPVCAGGAAAGGV